MAVEGETGSPQKLTIPLFCFSCDSQISGNRGLGQNTLNVLSHVGLFFDRLDVSMQNVSVTVSGLTDDVKLQINSLNNPRPAFQHFLDDLRAFGSLTASDDPQVVSSTKPLSTSTTEYPCPACSALGTTIAQLASDIETQTNGPLNSIETVNKTAQDQVVNAQGTILNAIGQARDQIGTIKGRATSYNSNVADYKTKADDYEKNRRIGGLVIFIIPMAICVFFWLAIWRKSELIVKILIHFMFFFGALMWLLFMVHLPFTLLFADGCHYLDVNDPQLGSIESISSISGPLTACLSQHSLLDALDVADQLAFTNITQTMPTPPDVNAILNFTGFTQLNSTVQALDLATAFPTYDPQDKYNSLTQLNMLTTTDQLHPQQYFVLENVTDTDPSDVGWQNNADVQKWKYAVLDAKKAEAQLQAVLQGIKTNMTTVSYEYTSVKDQIRTLVDHFVGLSGALQPIVDAALGVKAQTFCNPLDQDYGDMKSLFCSEMIVSISGLAMASFFVGIFIFGVNVSGWFLIYRLAHGPGSVASQKPDEMYAVNNAGMQMQPMAVPVTPMSPNGADYQVASPNSQAHIAAGVVTSEGPTLSEMVAAQPSAPQEF